MTNNDYILEKGEILSMIKECQDKQTIGIICVLILTGARISEVLLLRGKNIWSDDNFLYFRMKILKKKRLKFQEITRKVPKDGIFVKYLRDYINNARIQPNHPLFTYDRYKVWREIKKLNPNAKVHTFRHTLATWMGQVVDMRTLQIWFAWDNLNMAKIYVNPKDSINTFANSMKDIME